MSAAVIDHTSEPLGADIERCPKCGRAGRMVRVRHPRRPSGRPLPPFWQCFHVEAITASGKVRARDRCAGPLREGDAS